VKNTKNSKN